MEKTMIIRGIHLEIITIVVIIIIAIGCGTTKTENDDFMDFSQYGYGKIPNSKIFVGQVSYTPQGKMAIQSLEFKIDYDQLPYIDKRMVDENKWYKSGDSVKIRIDKSHLLYIQLPNGSWEKLRTDKFKFKVLKENISQFSKISQSGLTYLVSNISRTKNNGESELVVTLAIGVTQDIIRYSANDLRYGGGKIKNEPKIPSEKTNEVSSLDRLIGEIFGFICTNSMSLYIETEIQTLVLMDENNTPINSISANRETTFEVGLKNNFKELCSLMTIKDL